MDMIIFVRDDLVDFPSQLNNGNELVITGGSDGKFDENIFLRRLRELNGDSVRHIQVDVTSNLTTCRFLEFFPNAETLMLHGKMIRTTEGIFHAKSLRKLFVNNVNSARQNKVVLDELVSSNVMALELAGARLVDIEIIDAASKLVTLKITGGELVDFSMLKNSKIRELMCVNGRMVEVTGLSSLSSVQELWFSNCTKLESFSDASESVMSLTISACNKLDLNSINKIESLQFLTCISCKQLIKLSDLAELPFISKISLTNCKIDFEDMPHFRSKKMRKIWLSPAKEAFLQLLSKHHPATQICNGNATYLAGETRPVADFYEND